MCLLKHRHLDVPQKVLLARSLIFSRLFYGAETWPVLPPADFAKLHAFVLKVYRVILKRQNFATGAHSTDVEVMASLEAPEAADIIRVARLRHFLHALVDAPPALWCMVQLTDRDRDSWLGLLRDDLLWLQPMFRRLHLLPSPHDDLIAWMEHAKGDVSGWLRLCRSALPKSVRLRHLQAKAALWTQRCQAVMPLSPLPQDDTVTSCFVPDPVPGAYPCPDCGASFPTVRGLAVHRRMLHGWTADARAWMPCARTCHACFMQFGNTQKLRQHLNYAANGCLAKLKRVFWPMSQEEIDALEVVPAKADRYSHRVPAERMIGPCLPDRQAWHLAAPWKSFPVYAEAVDTLAPHHYEGLLDAVVNGDDPFCPPGFVRTLPALLVRDLKDFLLDFVHELPAGDLPPRLREQALQWCAPSTSSLPARTAPAATAPTLPATPPLDPRVDGVYRVIYLYAGHRRYGDVHAWADEMTRQYGFCIEIVPLDIVYEHRLCNLLLPESQDFWKRQLSDGRLLGMIMAPPCESWSVARWRSILAADGGPRPIRTSTHPWGAPDATHRQLRQVEVATDLLFVPAAASIWRLDIVKKIMRMPGVVLHRTLQGYFGASSAKPTFFLAYELPALSVLFTFWGHRFWPGTPWISLAGKGSDGQWLTTKAKAYPSRLNAALVEGFFQRAAFLQSQPFATCANFCPDFAAAVAAIRTAMSTSGLIMGADYAS
eukprot:Skav216784  [mRNA]  locus=scaffold579:180561:182699:+ [translate_table: standard]